MIGEGNEKSLEVTVAEVSDHLVTHLSSDCFWKSFSGVLQVMTSHVEE